MRNKAKILFFLIPSIMMIYFLFLSRFGHACHLEVVKGDYSIMLAANQRLSKGPEVMGGSFQERTGIASVANCNGSWLTIVAYALNALFFLCIFIFMACLRKRLAYLFSGAVGKPKAKWLMET